MNAYIYPSWAIGDWVLRQVSPQRWEASKYLQDDPVPVMLYAKTKKDLVREITMWIN